MKIIFVEFKEFIQIVCELVVVRRAIKYAIVVGFVLVSINYGDAILKVDVGLKEFIKICLTLIVPYLVSTFSSVAVICEYRGSKDT